jgi:hypothetical protein
VFGQIADTLDKWLNRPFLLAYFSPWLVFAFANGVVAYVSLPQAAAQIDRYAHGNPADKAIVIAVAVAVIAVVAYLSSLLLRGMTKLLEGQWLPEWLDDQLTVLHAEELAELEKRRDKLRNLLDELEKGSSGTEEKLQGARDRGVLGRHNLKPEQIEAAAGAVDVLWRKWYRNQIIKPDEVNKAAAALEAALSRNCADPAKLIAGNPALSQKLYKAHDDFVNKLLLTLWRKWYRNQIVKPDEVKKAAAALRAALAHNYANHIQLNQKQKIVDDDQAWSQKLHKAHDDFVNKLLPYALEVARERRTLTFTERYRRFAKAELAPTRLGNDTATLRSYCETRYNLDFDFFWPRLQIVLQKDQNLNTAIVNSKTQLDFAVLLFWLTALFTGVWLVVLTFCGNSLWAFVIVAALGPLVARLWLGIVQASYAAFAELARSAVDLKRLDLLTALHWPLPPTADAELLTWKAVGERMSIGPDPPAARTRNRETAFRHPTVS